MFTKKEVRDLPLGFHPFPGLNRKARRDGFENKPRPHNNSRPHRGRKITPQRISYSVATIKDKEYNMSVVDGVLRPVQTTLNYKADKDKTTGKKINRKIVKTKVVKGNIEKIETRVRTVYHERPIKMSAAHLNYLLSQH